MKMAHHLGLVAVMQLLVRKIIILILTFFFICITKVFPVLFLNSRLLICLIFLFFLCSYTREFVSSVWCIKILSPQEVQQMGKRGLELLNSVPIQRLSNNSCDDYGSRQDSRNLSSGITSVGSLDYCTT